MEHFAKTVNGPKYRWNEPGGNLKRESVLHVPPCRKAKSMKKRECFTLIKYGWGEGPQIQKTMVAEERAERKLVSISEYGCGQGTLYLRYNH